MDHPLSGTLEQLDRSLIGKIQIVDVGKLWEHIPIVGWMIVENKCCGELRIDGYGETKMLEVESSARVEMSIDRLRRAKLGTGDGFKSAYFQLAHISVEAFSSAQKRIKNYLTEMKDRAEKEGKPLMADGKDFCIR
ncbi:hypothetical protein Tco_0434339 [Tanacetum coccineum]